jgi:hypothetical protein
MNLNNPGEVLTSPSICNIHIYLNQKENSRSPPPAESTTKIIGQASGVFWANT